MSTKIWFSLGTAVLALMLFLLVGIFSKTPPDAHTLRYFTPEFLARAANYQRANLFLYIARQLIVWGFLIGAVLLSRKYFSASSGVSIPALAGYVALIFVIIYLFTLPLEYYQGFILEHRFGLSAQSPGCWLADYAKSKSLALALSVIIFTGLYALMTYFPTRWWWLAGAAFAVFLLAAAYLYPLIIDPLFYQFEPLKNEEMTAGILQMGRAAKIEIEEVLVANASARTRKVNAYFTGLGKTKRIVLYDNLLSQFPPRETLAVVAHEMGHWNHAHILKGAILGVAGAFLALFLFQQALASRGAKTSLEVIILAILFFTLFSFVSLPFQNTVSRFFEREADLEAMRLTRDPLTHVSLKQNLALANLSEVDPHPYVKYILYTHPTTMERINLALQVLPKKP